VYSLAQKRFLAIRNGEDEVALTADEVSKIREERRELLGLIRKYVSYSPIGIVIENFNAMPEIGESHNSPKLKDGGCTISMQLVEELLGEKQFWNKIIEEMIEHVPAEVIDADINCDECGKHPYDCECDIVSK